LLIAFVALAAARTTPPGTREDQSGSAAEARRPRGVEIIEHGGYPELRVDGAPFFIHSASFFYYRIPRDQWESLLKNYHSNGINTLDLYIPWNWHEPKEGEFDFDGHTNPRRNLRALLTLIAQEGFKLVARPGPEILNEWRHGGYPGWLLEQPEYKMDQLDWLEGRYPPLDGLNTTDAEAAAEGWLENPTHMAHARAWLMAVANELAHFSSHRLWRNPEQNPSATLHETSGPLLFVQLGDDFAIGRTNRTGADFWRYLESLRGAVDAGGLDLPVFINPTDMRVSAAGSALERPIGVMGQWYMRRRETDESGERSLTASDAGEIEFFTEELKTQPSFPPVMIEYQAGWYAPADDDRPLTNPSANTLLSSRLLLGNGIHGFNYLPLQDTYTPAGYSVPWANRTYRWDAALGPDGNQQPRLHAVRRNSALFHHWGPQLASSHKRADFGIAYPLGAYPQGLLSRQDILRVSDSVMKIERLGTLAMLSSELVDPEFQTVEQLLRDPLILIPVFDPSRPQFQLSERVQRTIVAYVRRGGTAVIFPERPVGSILDELWKTAPDAAQASANTAIRRHWKFGAGEVIESSKDFFSWIALDRGLAENRALPEAGWALSVLHEYVAAAGMRPTVAISGMPVGANQLIASEIVTNEGTGLLGERKGGQGFLSITNLASDKSADAFFEILSPAASARGNHTDYVPLHVTVPPRESLLLPLQTPLCFTDLANGPCGEEVVTAGAELLEAQRDGKSLVLLFYAPARAEIKLHLAEKPSNVALDDIKPEMSWDDSENSLQVIVPRGIAPQFHRALKIDLPNKPHLPELEKSQKFTPGELGYFVANAVRLPVSQGAFLRTYPPLVLLEPKGTSAVVLQAENFNFGELLSVDVSIQGPLRGGGTLHVLPRNSSVEKIELKPSGKELMAMSPAEDGFIRGTIELRVKNDRRKFPVAFLQPPTNGTIHYRYDFDRDGADEWVLENASMRMIVSPESGGQIIALVEKSSGANLSTSVGLLRDAFSHSENPQGANESRARGRYGLFNRTYAAEWQAEPANPALRLHYDAPGTLAAGARIEKTVQFESPTSLRVDYRVALNAVKAEAAVPSISPPQSFVVLNSFPASSEAERMTHFCWPSATASPAPDNSTKTENKESAKLQCDAFTPQGKAIEVPAGTMHVEIEMPARPTISVEWECATVCARMTIEQKNFSALFRLEFPPLVPGSDPRPYTLRIRTIASP
jgi:glycosyl hydrolase family 35